MREKKYKEEREKYLVGYQFENKGKENMKNGKYIIQVEELS